MNLLDWIATVVKSQGIDKLFCYPTTPVIEAMARAGIQPILCRQERVGVDMANGYARIKNGTPFSVFAMQYGPGVENAYPGIATAFSDSSPILMLPLGHKREIAQVTPSYRSSVNLKGVTRFCEEIVNPNNASDVLRRAMNTLVNGRRGPAVIELPRDLLFQEIPEEFLRMPQVAVAKNCASDDDIDRAAKLLIEAKNPIIQAGQGVLYGQACDELLELAQWLAIPVLTTVDGKSAFPESHPLALGCSGLVMTGHGQHFLDNADMVFGIGTSFTRHPIINRILPTSPSHKKVIHLTDDFHDLNKGYDTECALLGDARLSLRKLLSAVKDRQPKARVDQEKLALLKRLKKEWLQAWEHKTHSNETPMTPYRVITEFRKAMDSDQCIVTHDSGSPRDQILPFYEVNQPRSYLGWGQSHALGTGLGLTIGAKLAAPEKFCVNFMGDAAFGMTGLDFETSVRVNAPICTVVLNNSTMAIETKALEYSHEHFRTRDIGGQYADMGRALGGWSERIEDPAEIGPAFLRAWEQNQQGRSALLEIVTSAETAFSHRAVL